MADTRAHHHSAAWIDVLYRRTISLPLIAFIGAAITDWAYSDSANLMWANWSSWLLLIGLVGCGAALMELALGLRDRSAAGWSLMFVLLAAFALQIVNFMIHMRDGWSAVVPTGFMLSIVGAILTAVAAWLGRTPSAEVRA